MSETSDIVTPTLEALKLMGVVAWRVNAGGRVRRSIQAPPGTPDIIGYLPPNGRFFGLEAKSGKAELSEAQKKWHETAQLHGVLTAVIRSARDAVDFVKGWQIAARLARRTVLSEPCTNGALLGLTRSLDSTRQAGMRLAEPAPTPASKTKSRAPTATPKRSGKASRNMGVGNG